MLQRILGAVLVIAGLAAIAFGVATATVLRESDTVVATARPVGDGTLVVTDPGVLDLVDADVTVTASVPAGQEVTVVVGRDVDVLGWLKGDPYTRVAGLADWETLTTTAVTPEDADGEAGTEEDAEASEEAEEVELPDPAGSDMWVTELTAADEVSLRWNDRPGPWMLLAAGTGAAPAPDAAEEDAEGDAEGQDAAAEEAPEASDADAVAPTLELTWDREVSTPLLWPAVGLGVLLLLAGVVLLVMGRRKKKRTSRGRRSSAAGAAAAGASSAASPAPAGDSDPTSPGTPDSPASPFGATAVGGASTWPDPAAAPTWPAAVDAPDPTQTAVSPAVAVPGTEAGADDVDRTSAVDAGDEGSGTAPVPVAGRFSRRSRLRRTRSAPESAPEPSPADGDGSAAWAAAPSPLPAEPPTTTTGSLPTLPDGRPLTRRELRRQEEERRAGESSGMSRALRALTGQTPVVPPADVAQPDVGDAPAPSGRRAAAWRETWGFDASSAGRDAQHDDTTDEGTR